MRSGGGKPKGSKFEREVCVALSLWISNGERDDVFWRSSLSGGRATIALREGIKRQSQVGDISAIASLGEYLLNHVSIECKSYKNLQVLQSLIKDTGFLYSFWFKHRKQSHRFNKQPMLIAHQNHMPTMCLISDRALDIFKLTQDHVIANLPHWGGYLLLFDCFLREASVPSETAYISKRRSRLA